MHVWRDSFIGATRLTHTCNVTHCFGCCTTECLIGGEVAPREHLVVEGIKKNSACYTCDTQWRVGGSIWSCTASKRMRHVMHMSQSAHTCEWVTSSHTCEWVTSHTQYRVGGSIRLCELLRGMRHVTHINEWHNTNVNESRHTYNSRSEGTSSYVSCSQERDISHISNTHITHIWISHVTRMAESCRTYNWVVS